MAVLYACSFAPLALFDAFGLTSRRLVPSAKDPAVAGGMLHDNLCGHVKGVLERIFSWPDPQDLFLVVVSCDAMRRMADALLETWGPARVLVLDLPVCPDEEGMRYFAASLIKLGQRLTELTGRPLHAHALYRSLALRNELAEHLERLRGQVHTEGVRTGPAGAMNVLRELTDLPVGEALERIDAFLAPPPLPRDPNTVPVYLFGTIQPDPRYFDLVVEAGLAVTGLGTCDAYRPHEVAFALAPELSTPALLEAYASALLGRSPCPTLCRCERSSTLVAHHLAAAHACSARGAVLLTLKYCDPYLAKVPELRRAFQEANCPLLVLEGEAGPNLPGQARTRLQAFAELLTARGVA